MPSKSSLQFHVSCLSFTDDLLPHSFQASHPQSCLYIKVVEEDKDKVHEQEKSD